MREATYRVIRAILAGLSLAVASVALLMLAILVAEVTRIADDRSRPVPPPMAHCDPGNSQGDGSFCYIDQPGGLEWVFVVGDDGRVTAYSQGGGD